MNGGKTPKVGTWILLSAFGGDTVNFWIARFSLPKIMGFEEESG